MSFFQKIVDALTDSKARDIEKTRALHGQATKAFEASGLASVDFVDLATELIELWEDSEGKFITDELKFKLIVTTGVLFKLSGLYNGPPKLAVDDIEDAYYCRDWCVMLIDVYQDSERYKSNVFDGILSMMDNLLCELPEGGFIRDEAGGDNLSFPVPALHLLANAALISDKMLWYFFHDDVRETPIFHWYRHDVLKNIRSMEESYNIAEGRMTNISDFTNKAPIQELVDRLFRSTPLHDIFDFTLPITLRLNDRFKHQYVLGKTGSGKSVTLRYQIATDIQNGHGVVVITPEKALIDDALSYVPDSRKKDVVYFNAADDSAPVVGFNPFDLVASDLLSQKAGELEAILVRTLGDMGVKMMPVISNTIYALLQTGGSFADIPKLLDPWDSSFRDAIFYKLDARTQEFFTKYDQSRYYKDVYEPIINRLDTLLRAPLCETLTTASLNFSEILNSRSSIVLCDVSQLQGFQKSITGQLLLSTFQTTFFQRDLMPEKKRLPYFFYMDEFQTYATSSEGALKEFLTRARKYKVGIIMAHQNMMDIPGALLSSIFGNCGTLFGMLMSADDSRKFTKEAQLANFGVGTDSNASVQLQNFKPGECAVCTPENKKAQICRVPQFPPYKQRFYILCELKALSKTIYGLKAQKAPYSTESLETTDAVEESGDDVVDAEYIVISDENAVVKDRHIPPPGRVKKPGKGKQQAARNKQSDDDDWDDIDYTIS